MKKLIAMLLALVMVLSLVACGSSEPAKTEEPAAEAPAAEAPAAADAVVAGNPTDYLKGKTVRIVIGSTSVTGDTYLTADLVSRMISEKYGCNMKVDPIGAGRALEEVVSVKDEETIMMFHDMTYLGVLFGAYDAEDYALENMVIGGS